MLTIDLPVIHTASYVSEKALRKYFNKHLPDEKTEIVSDDGYVGLYASLDVEGKQQNDESEYEVAFRAFDKHFIEPFISIMNKRGFTLVENKSKTIQSIWHTGFVYQKKVVMKLK